MEGDAFNVLSGTRDEMGGVTISLVNIYERPERPGQASALLVMDAGSQIIAPGDVVAIGQGQFRLVGFEPHRSGATLCLWRQVLPDPPAPAQEPDYLDIPPLPAERLARLLMQAAPALMDATGWVPEWQENTRQTTEHEWNGGEIGPSTHHHWAAKMPDGTGEASATLDIIRYNPDEIYRQEVSFFWRLGDRSEHLFGRAEGLAPIGQVVAGGLSQEARIALLGILQADGQR